MEIVQIGNFMKGISAWDNPSVGRVYDQNFLAPTLNSGGGGGRQPYIIVEVEDAGNNCGHEGPIPQRGGHRSEVRATV
jgi:hypothetical protein